MITLAELLTIIGMVVGFLFTWWKAGQNYGQLTSKLENLEVRVNTHEAEQGRILDGLQKVVTQLAVLESSLRDTREERIRYHTENQMAISEVRRDITRLISAVAQTQHLPKETD